MHDQPAQRRAPLPGRSPWPQTRCPRSARSRFAEGQMMAALLPPSSRRLRPNRAATRCPTTHAPSSSIRWPRPAAPAGCSTSRSPTSRPPSSKCAQATRQARHACQPRAQTQCLHRKRRQRCLLRRLPHHRVAAHQRQCRIPRPHRNRKIERRDHPPPHPADATSPSCDGAAAPRAA